MIQHSILGQAGSGKSTFIKQQFGEDFKCIYFSVGSLLRKMLDQSGIADFQHNKNAWESANPLVYSTYKNLCLLSEDLQVPLVSDGFPRNGDQVITGINILKKLPASVQEIQLQLHMLDITKEEQIKRISDRQGISEYQIKRIHQSRLDYDSVISLLSKGKEKLDDMKCGRLCLQFNWWKPVDGKFELVNIA